MNESLNLIILLRLTYHKDTSIDQALFKVQNENSVAITTEPFIYCLLYGFDLR